MYPNDGVLVPPNLGKLEIHFLPGTGNQLFELAFVSPYTDVKVYLGCSLPMNGGCIYQPDPTVWHWLAETNRGSTPVAVSLRATDGKGGPVASAGPISIAFSQDDINGGIYYWRIGVADADVSIMRFDFASTTQTAAEKFVGTELTGGTCVGCHALSHDGSKIVAEAGGQTDGRILLVDVATKMPIVPFASTPKSFFESWNPDGSLYVGVDAHRHRLQSALLRWIDRGLREQRPEHRRRHQSAHPSGLVGRRPEDRVHPDRDRRNSPQEFYKGGIYMVTQSGGTWSAPAPIVPWLDGKNRYYPAFSPDNSFLVFDESTCSSGNMSDDCDADTNATATLFAVLPQMGATPVVLTKVNAGGPMDAGNTALTNTYPKWSPFVFQRTSETGARLEWMTFASKRKFGLRPLPPSNRGGDGTLLWMAAVDPGPGERRHGSSYSAFALPFQDLTTSNHIAQWTSKVIPPIQ